jgi:hypothetical protein
MEEGSKKIFTTAPTDMLTIIDKLREERSSDDPLTHATKCFTALGVEDPHHAAAMVVAALTRATAARDHTSQYEGAFFFFIWPVPG